MNSTPLATAIWPDSASRTLQTVFLVVLGSLLLTVSAKVSVPFWPVPLTLQTLAIMGIAATYGSRLAVGTVLFYFAQGFVGLPVFAGVTAGPAYFLGGTGGFLAGFVVLAYLVGLAADRGWDRSTPKLFATLLVADVIVFTLGIAWLAWFAVLGADTVGWGLQNAFMKGAVPYMLGDLLKIALVALAVPATWRFIDSRKG